MTAVAIELADLTRRWESLCAVDHIDLAIDSGQRVALIGPSGCGKSTLLNLIAGSLTPSEGTVAVAGRVIGSLSPRQLRLHRASCGIIPQGGSLVPQLTVHHNVLNGLLPRWPIHRIAAAALAPYAFERKRIHAWLDKVGLGSIQDQLAATLSGGEQQRVAVVRALLPGPALILADEPTASLDPSNAQRVADLLLKPEQPATVVLSTHWVSRIAGSVDRLIGLRKGRIVLDGSPESVPDAELADLYTGSDELR